MRHEIPFTSGRFIASKDELGYMEVLEKFQSAKTIRVVTYNLSKNDKIDKLFDRLQQLDATVDIQIVTNIPSRFNCYYKTTAGEYLRGRAKENIDTYIGKLNPMNFDAPVAPFFNFNNHGKIIGTEDIVYIGSANFSNESANNYETGVLIEDKSFIEQLYNTFFEDLKAESEPYFDDDFNKLRLFLISMLTRLNNHYAKWDENLFVYRDEQKIFIEDETFLCVNDLYELISDLWELDEIEDLIENLDCEEYDIKIQVNELVTIALDLDIDNVVDFITEDSPVYNYFSFSVDDRTNDILEDYAAEAYDEHLEHYVQKSSDEARDELSEVCSEAESDIIYVHDRLNFLIESICNMIDILADISDQVINPNIDNT